MILPVAAIVCGLFLMIWSADRFVEGASASAAYFGMSPLLIGMIIVGFGTSAPELIVSAMASMGANPGLALGNAYGSNICNIALILGVSALISPLSVKSTILKKELPVLAGVTGIATVQAWDGKITRIEGWVLLAIFSGLLLWSLMQEKGTTGDSLGVEMSSQMGTVTMTIGRAVFWVIAGLVMLITSSRLLVWGAVTTAKAFGVSDLLIGLTIVALGTSLPELASSVIAARKGAHDIALGNVIGSNLFNTLAVVGLAGVISPIQTGVKILQRDIPVMALLTLSLFVMGMGIRGKPGSINRSEGAVLLFAYFAYTVYLIAI